MTSDPFIIKKINFVFILPRHCIDRLLQLDLRTCAVRKACKNFSGLTSYFTERKARYSPIDGLSLMFFHLLPLHFKVTFISKPFRLIPSVPPENVASLVRLEIPRRNQNNITFPNPHPPFQLAAHSTEPFFAILTLNHDSFSTQHFKSHTQNIASTRQQHFFKVPFISDFSFTHLPTPNNVVALARNSFVD
jgi:hypothetical protein